MYLLFRKNLEENRQYIGKIFNITIQIIRSLLPNETSTECFLIALCFIYESASIYATVPTNEHSLQIAQSLFEAKDY